MKTHLDNLKAVAQELREVGKSKALTILLDILDMRINNIALQLSEALTREEILERKITNLEISNQKYQDLIKRKVEREGGWGAVDVAREILEEWGGVGDPADSQKTVQIKRWARDLLAAVGQSPPV